MSEQKTERFDFRGLGNRALRITKHVFLHNWPYKLLALALAVILWAGLIAQDPTLTRDKTFSNVSVNVTGMDSLKKNGYVVVNDVTELLNNCQFTVAVPQQQYDEADASMFNIRLDLSKIRSAGPQEVRLQYTNSSTYGNVTAIYPETITVDVEEYLTRSRIPVSVSLNGETPEGWYVTAPTADPALIAVSGPKSIVETISRAKVAIDPEQIEWTEGACRIAVPFELYDRSGEIVDNPQIETTSESVYIESVIMEMTLYPMKEVKIGDLGLVTGAPAKNYAITNIMYTPDKLYIAGPQTVLDTIETAFISGNVDASRKNESFSQQVKVIRPAETVWISSDTLNAEIEISPVVGEKTFQQMPVKIINVPDGMKASSDIQKVDIVLTGENIWLDDIRKNDITLFVDLNGLAEEGVYSVSLDCNVNGSEQHDFSWAATEDNIEITLAPIK